MAFRKVRVREIIVPSDAGDNDPRIVLADGNPFNVPPPEIEAILAFVAGVVNGGPGAVYHTISNGGSVIDYHMSVGREQTGFGQVFDLPVFEVVFDLSSDDGANDRVLLRAPRFAGFDNEAIVRLGQSTIQLDAKNVDLVQGGLQLTGDPAYVLMSLNRVTSGLDQNLTVAGVTVDNSAIAVTTQKDNALYEAEATFDFHCTVSPASFISCTGALVVNGVEQASKAIVNVKTQDDRATVSQRWSGTLPIAGPHTFELLARRTLASGTQVVHNTHTTHTLKIFER